MTPISRVVLCCLCVLSVCEITFAKPTTGTKKTKMAKVKKVKKPKMNIKTLAAKVLSLESRLSDIETQVTRIGQAQGLFRDDPPCPIQNTDGYNMSEVTQSCYTILPSAEMMNWTDAQDYCSTNHPKAHLVAIESQKEETYLKAKWYNEYGISSVSRFWTDGSKLGHDDWFWVTGASRIQLGYTNWIPATSHNNERFSCLAVYANEGFAWGDVACWAPHVVTCEIEL